MVQAWRCASCHELVADGDEDEHAVDCCAFAPEEAFVCLTCRGLWETAKGAVMCCAEHPA
jgi:hypothetical protein